MTNKLKVEGLCERELLEKILHIVERQEKPPSLNNVVAESCLYDNKSLMAKLGVKEKYLKKLRDNGYLGYSREGDKYWYTQEDLERFLRRFHYDDFAIGKELPKREGVGYDSRKRLLQTCRCGESHNENEVRR